MDGVRGWNGRRPEDRHGYVIKGHQPMEEHIVRDAEGKDIGMRGAVGPGPCPVGAPGVPGGMSHGDPVGPCGPPIGIAEEQRKMESIRGMILECINIAWREYGVKGLKHFRMRVEDAKTMEEIVVARDMLLTIGRFHDTSCPENTRAEHH